jgi:hypothetical protein
MPEAFRNRRVRRNALTRSHDIATRSQAAAFDLARLWLEAGTVITLRMWGLGSRQEARRMVDEKAPAHARAVLAAWQASALAAWRQPFDAQRMAFAATDAWTRSLVRKTRATRTRLTRSARR